MQNKEFKRVWEKEGRRLMKIEKQKAADQHKVEVGKQNGVKPIANKATLTPQKKYSLPVRPKRRSFREVW